MIVGYLTDKVSAKAAEIAEDLAAAKGANRNRTYRLQS